MRHAPRPPRALALGGALLLSAAPLSAQVVAMPRLQHGFVTSNIDVSPLNRLTSLAVGPQGAVFFLNSPTPKETLLTLVDSTGKVILRVGKKGEGPGEVISPSPVEVTRDRISVWDGGTGRFQSWDFRGALTETVRPAQTVELKASTPELVGTRRNGSGWRPVIVNRTSGELREVLAPTDSFMTSHFEMAQGKPRNPYSPIFGMWDGGLLMADAQSYSLALYRWDGTLVRTLKREVPPMRASAGRADDFIATLRRQAAGRGAGIDEGRVAEMRKQALDMVLPPITPGGVIRADARRRIWVLGMEGDSAFADLFTSDHYLGRLHLPCRLFNGFWSLSGSWLAVACVPDDPKSDLDAVIKTFRIVDAKP